MKVRARILVGVMAAGCLLSWTGFAAEKAAANKGTAAVPAPAAAPAAAPAEKAPSGQYKIGVIDTKRILQGYSKVGAEYKRLQDEVDKRNAEMDKVLQLIQDDEKAYQAAKKDKSLSSDDATQKEVAISSAYTKYKADLQTQQNEIDSKELVLKKKFLGDIKEAVDQIAAAENYHIILTSASAIYFSTPVDITEKVVALLNSKP